MNRAFCVAGAAEWLQWCPAVLCRAEKAAPQHDCGEAEDTAGRAGWRGACTQRRGNCQRRQPCRTDISSSPPLCSVTSNTPLVNRFCIATQNWPHPSSNKWYEIDTLTQWISRNNTITWIHTGWRTSEIFVTCEEIVILITSPVPVLKQTCGKHTWTKHASTNFQPVIQLRKKSPKYYGPKQTQMETDHLHSQQRGAPQQMNQHNQKD